MMRWVWGLAFLVAAACGESSEQPTVSSGPTDIGERTTDSSNAELDENVADAFEVRARPPSLSVAQFLAPSPWAEPIADYYAAGLAEVGSEDFERGISDLQVFDGRLHLGYGDATHNLGRVIPIEPRYFADPGSSEALADFQTDEEQIERYRVIDDTMYVAGVDATEDAWLGNVYVRPAGGPWTKNRTVADGVHVHDITGWNGALWAVGSGATSSEWGKGQVYSYLWRAGAPDAPFQAIARDEKQGGLDTRWVRVVPQASSLLLFGYRSVAVDGQVSIELKHRRYDGSALSPLSDDDPLNDRFVLEAHPLPDGRTILRSVDVSVTPPVHAAEWLTPSGELFPFLSELDLDIDTTVQDVEVINGVGWLALTTQSRIYPNPSEDEPWNASVVLWTPEGVRTLLEFTPNSKPRSVAYWWTNATNAALYIGLDDGVLLRAPLQ